jgi:hypothetical protein
VQEEGKKPKEKIKAEAKKGKKERYEWLLFREKSSLECVAAAAAATALMNLRLCLILVVVVVGGGGNIENRCHSTIACT